MDAALESMSQDTGRRLPLEDLARCIKPVETASSLPPVCYRDDAVLQQEYRAIFQKRWIGVGRADRLSTPGDFETLDIGDVPVILIAGKDGEPRAFANSCRHRGARLLDGSGNCRGIRCPFHSWAYTLDGRLAGVPRMEDAADFERADYGLIEFRVAIKEGFLFVCLSQETPDLDHCLGDFTQRHQAWPLAGLVSLRRRSLQVDCNWKSFLEVFNEYYHLPYVHAGSIDGTYDIPEPADRTVGDYASQFGRTKGTGGLLDDQKDHTLPSMPGLTGEAREGVRYSWLFPNMTFAACMDSIWIYEAYPLGPGRCQVFQTFCLPPESVALPNFDARVEHYFHRLDTALNEDIPALENHQRGLNSPFAKPGRFSPLMEPNVASFAHWYARQLTTEQDG